MLRHAWPLALVLGITLSSGCDNDADRRGRRCFGPDNNIYYMGETFNNGCNSCVCNEDGSISCTDVECTTTCTHENQTYDVGESFPAGDGCNLCTCMSNGAVECTTAVCGQNCTYAGTEYSPGDTFDALDGCNTCECYTDGNVGCTELACACNPTTEWWREYMSTMPQQCTMLDFMCPTNTTRFDNTCGCGCEQDSACAESYDCTPPNPCDVMQIQTDCPYSEIIQ